MAIDLALLLAAGLVLVPIGVLVVESFLALLPRGAGKIPADSPRTRGVVLVPAHDEEGGIVATIHSILPQLGPDDRLVVVADNCTDGTAQVARSAGATVLERHDTSRRGKGYALDFGVRALEPDPPAVVVIVDADCVAHPGTVDRLLQQVAATGRPGPGPGV